jgi:hypothetical protein
MAAQAYYNNGVTHTGGYLPPSLDVPWANICARLKRRTQLTFWDNSMYNWAVPGCPEGGREYDPGTLVFYRLERSVSILGSAAERLFFLAFVSSV